MEVLDDISIQFEENKITCILGPSGCGKTTLLNIIAGTLDKDYGEVIGFEKEDISFVFQEDRLVEWKNVKDNIGFVLKDKMDKKLREDIIDQYLSLVNLEEYKLYYPRQLSGGMRQRISILRAFAYPSKILIMDEPFKSLDINLKRKIMEFVLKLKEIKGKTCILITHDIEEAISLGDRIIILTGKPAKIKKIIENIPSWDNSKERKSRLEELIENQLIT